MRVKLWPSVTAIVMLLVLLVSMPLLSACGGAEPAPAPAPSPAPTPAPTPAPAPAASEFDTVKATVADFLTHKVPHISASDLQMKIAALRRAGFDKLTTGTLAQDRRRPRNDI